MIIGITGGTGSGKSTACRELERLGCVVIDADAVYAELTRPGMPLLKMLADEFGADIAGGGGLDRKKLAQRAFASEAASRRLNEITHREIKKEINRRIDAAKSRVVVLDVPLLYEAGFDRRCDEVWVVTAPVETRIRRVMARDNISREEVIARMDHQLGDEERIARADAVIESGTIEELRESIAGLLRERLNNGEID